MFVIPNIPEPLSRAIYADLLNQLPSPAEDTAEARALRDERAVTAVAHLLPENAAEAEVAVLIVGAQFHARDALRSAAAHAGIDPAEIRRCRAQAASMMRQADSGIRTLMRLQAERHKAEDALRPFAMQRAGYWWKEVSAPAPDRPREGGDPGACPRAGGAAAIIRPARRRTRQAAHVGRHRGRRQTLRWPCTPTGSGASVPPAAFRPTSTSALRSRRSLMRCFAAPTAHMLSHSTRHDPMESGR